MVGQSEEPRVDAMSLLRSVLTSEDCLRVDEVQRVQGCYVEHIGDEDLSETSCRRLCSVVQRLCALYG